MICTKAIFLCGLLSFCFNGWALSQDKCSTRDLRPKLPDRRNQTDTEWCAWMTCADMISFQVGFKVSAADLVLQNFYAYGNSLKHSASETLDALTPIYDTADPCSNVIRNLDGVCREADFPSEVLNGLSFSQYWRDIEAAQQNFDQRFKQSARERKDALDDSCSKKCQPSAFGGRWNVGSKSNRFAN